MSLIVLSVFLPTLAGIAEVKEAPRGMLIPLMVLAGLSLLLGIFPNPLTEFAGGIVKTLM